MDKLYNKFGASLYGYILSVVKDKEQSEKVFVKMFTDLKERPQNPEEECHLLKYIQIANKIILEITKIEQSSLLSIINKKRI